MKTVLLAGLLMAWPLLGQNPPPQSPPPQNPPAQAPPDQNPPKLEQPQMEAPAPADEKKPDEKKPEAKKTSPPPPTKKYVEGEGKVVEEIIARVNNEIITRSELEKARAAAAEDAQQDCTGRCTQEQLQVAIEDRQKFALRDLIDQSLLSQRGKDMGINVEGDVVKQLDQIRIQNKLPDMDALERAVTSQGINWDDFKTNIRNRILTQSVIGQEVSRHITIGHEEEMKYYNEHKSEFVRPEQVALSAI